VPEDDSEVSPGSARASADPALGEADLAERFRKRVVAFALRRLRNLPAAEEVAQEVLRRVLEALRAGRLGDPEALPSFVLGTAQNVCLHRVRGAGRERRALEAWGATDERAREDSPLEVLVRKERCEEVRAAMARLGAEDRDLLRLLYHEEVEPNDIALRLRITAGALRARKHRALQRLSTLLGDATGGNVPRAAGTQE
jgi:RNA polymerase sigma-70 factor (ECF subfamily)